MEYVNALINEKSPYLQQHAHNPVNWYPWGDAAFQKAKKEDKPVFLSIGYSTCHWCHVMERESFEDIEIAKLLNDNFVSVKVDREERPDIDAVYMEICQMLTGSGGWPTTIIMTAEQKPFFAGTYFPKHSGYGRLGLSELLEKTYSMWNSDRQKLLDTSERIIEYLNINGTKNGSNQGGKENAVLILDNAFKEFSAAYDSQYGGFGAAPKFPSPNNLFFLLKYSKAFQNKTAESIVENTLLRMFRGGIYDHIGGGFSRYSTDNIWLVPHFEKMLYDNALLIFAYSSFIEISKSEEINKLFSEVIAQIFRYTVTELRNKDGGFFCSQDADSNGREGEFYLLTPKEIYDLLDKETAGKFCTLYDITASGHLDGKAIPNLIKDANYTSAVKFLDTFRDKLIRYRKNRTELFTDDKILTSWNSLIIAGLAKAGRVLNYQIYIKYAKEAADFIEKNLTDGKGGLYLRWKNGEKKNPGQLDDYAFYAWSLIELYESSFDAAYLLRAAETAEKLYGLFSDKSGGLFLYSKDDEQLISRPKEFYDGAIPSGNSVAAMVFLKLFKLTAEPKWKERSEKLFDDLTAEIKKYPMGHGFALYALSELTYPSGELICVIPDNKIPQVIKKLSNLSIIIKTPENYQILEKCAPFLKSYQLTDKPAYYFCHNGRCEKPVSDEKELLNLVSNNSDAFV